MSSIRKLSIEDLDEFARIDTNAYPGVYNHTPEMQERLKSKLIETQKDDDSVDYFGLFREEKLLGGMRIHHYSMNLLSNIVPVGGVGSVAVDLLHKKEKVAKELIEYFLRYFRDKKVSMVALYPFRPDFYKQMGFGYGTKINQYKVKPHGFKAGKEKDNIQYITVDHKQLVIDCYNRFMKQTHGMMGKTTYELEALFKNPNMIMIGYLNEEKLEGYLSFSFKRESETNFTFNDIHVKEFVYENNEALSQLLSFLYSQADQFNRVVINTQDEHFHFLLNDPSNGTNEIIPSVYHESHTSGVGIMYRIVDIAEFFKQLNQYQFGNANCTIKLTVYDSFLPENEQNIVIKFNNGYQVMGIYENFDVELTLDISDFSSVVMCATDIKSLHRYGLVKLSDIAYLNTLNQMFKTHDKPICMTAF